MKRGLFLCIVFFFAANAFAQGSLSVFDVDASNFPTMKAKFYAFDANGNQQSPNPSDITITEDGVPRTVVSVTCPPPTPSRPLSSVLVMDVSGSMSSDAGGKSRVSIAQDVARLWVNAMPQGLSECAITSFDDANHLHQDFTTNRTKLLGAIQTISLGAGTDYNMGLLEPLAGGLQISKRGKQQKIIVFLTDGLSSNVKINEIIAEAKRQNCIIYCVTIGLTCPQSLKDISEQTGGEWFEDVVTQAQADDVYTKILFHAQNGLPPCEIAWRTEVGCAGKDRILNLQTDSYSAAISYTLSQNMIASLNFNTRGVFFDSKPVGIRFDTLISITAENASFDIQGITSTNPDYDINPKKFFLKAGESKTVTISFTPSDSSYSWSIIKIQSDRCEQSIFASGGYPMVLPRKRSIKVESPNGSEIYIVNSDTLITWSGIPQTDTIKLELSTDQRQSWSIITSKATGGSFYFHLPNTVSNVCLIRATQPTSKNERSWALSAGGNSNDMVNAVTVDHFGNTYVTGKYESTAYFGPDSIYCTSVHYMMFIAKYHTDGSFEWVKDVKVSQRFCGIEGNDIAVDSAGNVYVTGEIFNNGFNYGADSTTVDFSGVAFINSDLHSIFIAKYNSNGDIQWAKQAGTFILEFNKIYDYDYGMSIASDPQGNIFVTGSYTDGASFDGIILNGVYDYPNYFLAKYNSSGVLQWIRSSDSMCSAFGRTTAVNVDGTCMVVGYHSGTLKIGSSMLYSFRSQSLFIAKYDSNGDVLWVQSGSGHFGDSGGPRGLTVDIDGNTYLSGHFKDSIIFGNDILLGGEYGFYLVKVSKNGIFLWAKACSNIYYGGRNINSAGGGIVADRFGCIYMTGRHGKTPIVFDADTIHTNSSTPSNLIIIKLSTDGKYIKHASAYMSLVGDHSDIAIDPLENLYIAGYFGGKGKLGDYTLTPKDSTNDEAYLWKIGYDVLQSDTSDAVFSIVMPQYVSTDIDMGKVVLAKAKDSVITTFIRNTGTYPFRVDSIWLSGSGAFSLVSGIPPFDVPVGTARQVEFRFRPPSVGMHQATITIRTQADTIQQTIRGEGVLPQVQALGEVIDFGQVSLSSTKDTIITVAIQNIGTAPVNFTGDVQLGPDMVQYSVLSGGGAFTLLPNESHTVTLRFAPQFIGRSSGRIGFSHDAPGSPATLTLFGWGIGGEVYIPNDSAAPGEHPKIPILLGGSVTKNYSKLGAVKFKAEVEFNSTLLAPDGVILPSVIDKGRRTLTIEASWDGSSDTLTTIPFIAALGDAETTTMNIPKFEWLDNFGAPITLDIETRSGSFKVSELCREGGTRLISTNGKFLLSEPTPNPSSSYATIHYDLIEEGQTELLITDVIGRNVRTLFSGEGKPGSYTIRVNTDELASGKYFYTLRTPTLHAMKMMLVEH